MRKAISTLCLVACVCFVVCLQVGCAADQCGKPGLSCPDGKTCSFEPTSKVMACLATCKSDSDCSEGTKCQLASATGEAMVCKPSCKADADCSKEGEGLTCQSGLCKAGSSSQDCKSDSDCSGGQTCKSGKCETITTTTDCKENVDCKGGEVCKSGKCEKITTTTDCKADSDCSGGQTCNSGKCEAVGSKTCQYNSECGAGLLCKNGTCTNSCDASQDQCTEGYVCKDGTCQKGCASSADCQGGQVCESGQCVAASGCSVTGCPSGQACKDNVCVNDTSPTCTVKATRVAAGIRIELVGLSSMAIDSLRCETPGFETDGEEGRKVSVIGNVGVCPGNMPYFHLVRGSDWPAIPANCKLEGVDRKNSSWSSTGQTKPASWARAQ